jgi:phospholipid/cholesterol/gamma-HCH transport system substrate-binding protein
MKKVTKKVEPTIIGIFVVLSLSLFMLGVILFGGGKFFEKENLVIAYFDDSLKGLSVGAPVTYRGVSIGLVKEIQLKIIENGSREHKVIIPILIALNGGQNLVIQGPEVENEQEVDDFLESMCKQGLRAKLKTISLVTGKRYIDLAMYKDSVPVYRDKSGKYLEIPTLPSDMLQAQKIIENMDFGKLYNKVLGTFESLDTLGKSLSSALTQDKTEQLMADLMQVATKLNTILDQVDNNIGPILSKLDSGISDINTTVSNADKFIISLDDTIQPVATDFSKTLQNFDNTLLQADHLLRQAEQTLQPTSPLYFQMSETLQQLEETGKAIQKLSDFISRNPDSLLFGLQRTGEINEQK